MVDLARQAGTDSATGVIHAYVRAFLAEFEDSDELFGAASARLLAGLFAHEDFREALVECQRAGGDVYAVLGIAKESA